MWLLRPGFWRPRGFLVVLCSQIFPLLCHALRGLDSGGSRHGIRSTSHSMGHSGLCGSRLLKALYAGQVSCAGALLPHVFAPQCLRCPSSPHSSRLSLAPPPQTLRHQDSQSTHGAPLISPEYQLPHQNPSFHVSFPNFWNLLKDRILFFHF